MKLIGRIVENAQLIRLKDRKKNLFFRTGYCTDSYSVMKMKERLVENAQLIRQNDRETNLFLRPS